jgi:hypothetical protein
MEEKGEFFPRKKRKQESRRRGSSVYVSTRLKGFI